MDGLMEGPASDPDEWIVGLVIESIQIADISKPTKQDVAAIIFGAWDFIEANFETFNEQFNNSKMPLKTIEIYTEIAWDRVQNFFFEEE